MFETIYLTSAEKSGFLNEFAQNIIAAAAALKKEQGKKALLERDIGEKRKKPREENLGEKAEVKEAEQEKAKLITRQFPGFEAAVKPLTAGVSEEAREMPRSIESKEQFLTLNDKVDSLLNDASVRIIECSDGIVRVSKGAGSEETGFKLSEEETLDVIKKFSEKTKIPFDNGLFKAKAGNLVITAVLSDFIGNRFLIKKTE